MSWFCFVAVILSCRMSQAGVRGGVVQLLQHTCGQPNEQAINTMVQLSLVRLFSALQWLCALQLCSDWTRDGAFEDSQSVTSCVSNNFSPTSVIQTWPWSCKDKDWKTGKGTLWKINLLNCYLLVCLLLCPVQHLTGRFFDYVLSIIKLEMSYL